MNHLKSLIPTQPIAEGPPRRGFAGQRLERENELVVRRHVVAAGQQLFEQGWSWTETAELLKLSPRTLRDWRLDSKRGDLRAIPLDRPVIVSPREEPNKVIHSIDECGPSIGLPTLRAIPLGRPVIVSPREERNKVIHSIDECGPSIGLPTLRAEFPAMARAELENLLLRYRRVWRKRNRQPLRVLHWTCPGAVWAIDFHGPRPLIDGLYPNLLAVRDLSSGKQLLWLPTQDMKAQSVLEALEGLFAEHGAPLVLKSDNGSAFIDVEVRKLLAIFGVKNLYSPPRMPRYNGSIEAGIGSLKSRTEQHATRQGHPGYWTWHDAEAARLEANATARPRGPLGPSPDEMWAARTPITEADRNRFSNTVANQRRLIEAAQGGPHENPTDDMHDRATDRDAISHALVEYGYLYFTGRSIPLPITTKKVASIL